MEKVVGKTKSIKELLGDSKEFFTIGYFQREYDWKEKHVQELVTDLLGKFNDNYKSGDERDSVNGYGHYFLGSIIVSAKENSEEEYTRKTIIDGQQRLTSLTLLFIHLYHRIKDEYHKNQKGDLKFSQEYGNGISSLIYRDYGDLSFRLDVPERNQCMNALFNGEKPNKKDQQRSVLNIIARYEDIQKHFPSELSGEALTNFTSWLLKKVNLVEITSDSGINAYTIFETMNDRGLPLTPADKLKGYLVFSIVDPNRCNAASELWQKQMLKLKKNKHDNIPVIRSPLAHRGTDNYELSEFIISWLTSQYAEKFHKYEKRHRRPIISFRRDRFDEKSDFISIAGNFYRWVREHDKNRLNLKTPNSFFRFIKDDFVFYSNWYKRIEDASREFTEGLEAIYLAWGGIVSHSEIPYTLLLAPLRSGENKEESLRKLRIIAKYVDILMSRYSWNWESAPFSFKYGRSLNLEEIMTPQLIIDIRRKPAKELADMLIGRLEAKKNSFDSTCKLLTGHGNRTPMHRLLARITDYIETNSTNKPSHYEEYLRHSGSGWEYEIEHILPTKRGEGESEFKERAKYRNNIGALLLLPVSPNRSYSDMPYREKLRYYYGENLLAKSLHERTYTKPPGFRRFNDRLREEIGHEFEAYSKFSRKAILERQKLYRAIAKKIWDPENLRLELEN